MISRKRLEEQLKKINFHYKGWGRSEVDELTAILMSDEEIEECVNGYYEAGFALLVATKDRVLLVDKKPLGYLTVEDLRFDMITELDLHHRMLGAQIRINAGSKTLLFTSLNQVRLRRLLNYVQTRITQIKKDHVAEQSAQKQHLEEMNEQLRLYLMSAHKQQYLDQASSIRPGAVGAPADLQPIQSFQLPPTSAPAEVFFSQPQQFLRNAPAPAAAPVAPQNTAPATPFEQAAAKAFDAGGNTAPPEPPPLQLSQLQSAPSGNVQAAPAAPATGEQGSQEGQSRLLTPQQVGLAAVQRVVPIVTAYTRLPLINQRRQMHPPRRTALDS